MRIAVLVIAVVALFTPCFGITERFADHDFLVKQKFFFEIFRHVHQPLQYDEYLPLGKEFVRDSDKYTDFTKVEKFFAMYDYGMLPPGRIFSVMNRKQMTEARALFKLFYYSKDWPTFQQNVVFARQFVNEGMFVYALTIAVVHRKDMHGIVLPAVYEIYPYYFFPAEVTQEAYQYKMQGHHHKHFELTIPTNYTGWYLEMNDEQRLSYFTEDIGLNSYYYYFHTDYPFWMGGDEFGLANDRRGEQYMYMYQQLLARYYLERLANNMGSIPDVSLHLPVKTGYYPSLRYYSGIDFPARENYYNVEGKDDCMHRCLEDYIIRIHDAIDYGFIVTEDGKKIDLRQPESVDELGKLVNANPDSPNARFYRHVEIYGRILFGSSKTHYSNDYNILPSVLEQFETSMRDPVFYQIYKTMTGFWFQFKNYLPEYKHDELLVAGVKIDDVQIGKLQTFFDFFDSDISNAIDMDLYAHPEEFSQDPKFKDWKKSYKGATWDFMPKARQYRLNHDPFSFSLDVTSDHAMKAVVRVYMAPKYDDHRKPFTFNSNRENFVELDQFAYDLTVGTTTIKRSSRDFYYNIKDRTTYAELYKRVLLALDGTDKFPLDMSEAHCGWPDRLLLPKGSRDGFAVQFYFIISEYKAPKTIQYSSYDQQLYCGTGSGAMFIDDLPFGYPFDRKINDNVFWTPNMFMKDVFVFHDTERDIRKSMF